VFLLEENKQSLKRTEVSCAALANYNMIGYGIVKPRLHGVAFLRYNA